MNQQRGQRNGPSTKRIHVKELDGEEQPGKPGKPPRSIFYSLFEGDSRLAELEVHVGDSVELSLPEGEEATLVFLPRRFSDGAPLSDTGPFGKRVIDLEGTTKLECAVPRSGKKNKWRYPFILYLEGRDHLVDGNSTPIIIVHDP